MFKTIKVEINEEKLDRLAEKVFLEAIKTVGGIKKLIEFRNLTWVSSLATASYVVVMKEVFLYTKQKIAEELGISTTTVENILSSNPEKIEKFIEGELEKIDEHKAGAMAKLALKKLKERKELYTLEISEENLKEIESFIPEAVWPIIVLHYIKGIHFPTSKEEIKKRLMGKKITIEGKSIDEKIEKLPKTIKTPAELLKLLKNL